MASTSAGEGPVFLFSACRFAPGVNLKDSMRSHHLPQQSFSGLPSARPSSQCSISSLSIYWYNREHFQKKKPSKKHWNTDFGFCRNVSGELISNQKFLKSLCAPLWPILVTPIHRPILSVSEGLWAGKSRHLTFWFAWQYPLQAVHPVCLWTFSPPPDAPMAIRHTVTEHCFWPSGLPGHRASHCCWEARHLKKRPNYTTYMQHPHSCFFFLNADCKLPWLCRNRTTTTPEPAEFLHQLTFNLIL